MPMSRAAPTTFMNAMTEKTWIAAGGTTTE